MKCNPQRKCVTNIHHGSRLFPERARRFFHVMRAEATEDRMDGVFLLTSFRAVQNGVIGRSKRCSQQAHGIKLATHTCTCARTAIFFAIFVSLSFGCLGRSVRAVYDTDGRGHAASKQIQQLHIECGAHEDHWHRVSRYAPPVLLDSQPEESSLPGSTTVLPICFRIVGCAPASEICSIAPRGLPALGAPSLLGSLAVGFLG